MAQVAIFIGSASDEPVIAPCAEVLRKLGVSYRFTVTSAHRTPERTEALVRELEAEGCRVFICAAGMARTFQNIRLFHNLKPVIGIPVSGAAMGGMDALLSTVQMPPGFPVATVALDKAGARNAAWLAAQILALTDPGLAAALAVNNAGIGVAAGVSGIAPGWAALANFLVTLAALPLGRALGDKLAGRLLGKYALPLSGLLLILLGVWEMLG